MKNWFHELSILMYFRRNLEFSARSAKMKRSMSFFDMFMCCVAFCAFTFVCDCMFEVVLHCIVVLSSVLCSSACFILQWFHPSARSLSHPRSLSILPSRFCVAPSGFNLSCLVLLLSIGCLFALLFRFVSFESFFCKSLLLSRRSALRVSPAETRLTVYRRLSITTAQIMAEGVPSTLFNCTTVNSKTDCAASKPKAKKQAERLANAELFAFSLVVFCS